jgi:hypothetical protein
LLGWLVVWLVGWLGELASLQVGLVGIGWLASSEADDVGKESRRVCPVGWLVGWLVAGLFVWWLAGWSVE